MAIPDAPYTRKEMYLNAMATGDASAIPSEPYTRTEQYLDYIAKNGGGGSGGGVLVVNVTDQEVSVGGQTTTVQVCDKTAAEIFEAAQESPVWFYYYQTNESHGMTVQGHSWGYLESAILASTYSFYTSAFDGTPFEFKASNGSDFPATEPSL